MLGPLRTTLDLAVTTRSTHARHQPSLESPVLSRTIVLLVHDVVGRIVLAPDLLAPDLLVHDRTAVVALTVKTTGIVPAVVETIVVVVIQARHRTFGLVVVLRAVLSVNSMELIEMPPPRVRGHRTSAVQHTAQGLVVHVLVVLEAPVVEKVGAQVGRVQLGFHLVDGQLLLVVHLLKFPVQRPGAVVTPLKHTVVASQPHLVVGVGHIRHGRNHAEITPLRPLQVLDHDLARTHGQPLSPDHTALPLTLVAPVAALPASTTAHPIGLLAIVEHPELHLSDRRSSDITSERTTCACRAVVLQLVLDFLRDILCHLHLDRLTHGQSEDHAGGIVVEVVIGPLLGVVRHVTRRRPEHGDQVSLTFHHEAVAGAQALSGGDDLLVQVELALVDLQIFEGAAPPVNSQVQDRIPGVRVRVVLFSRVALVETKCGRSCHENSTSSGELGVSLGIRCISAKLHSSEDVGAGFSLPPWRAKARPYIYTLMESRAQAFRTPSWVPRARLGSYPLKMVGKVVLTSSSAR